MTDHDFDVEERDHVEVTFRQNDAIHSRIRGRVRSINERPSIISDVAIIELPFGLGANPIRVREHEVDIEEVGTDE